jgi:adenylate kinase
MLRPNPAQANGRLMRLILLGPPGSGKGTQAKLLRERLNLEHIGTGDILRQSINRGTPAGNCAKPFVARGLLVPDDLVNDVVADRFRQPDRPDRFVMDGYPRTVAQAKAFDVVLGQLHLKLTAVILLLVDDAEIIRRVSGRWSCPKPNCKRTYHITSNPPKVDLLCDVDRTPLVQRDDDRVETLRERLVVYHRNTVELFPYYRSQGLLREVPGQGGIEDIYNQMMQALSLQAGDSC